MGRRHRFDFRVPFADVDHAGIVYYPRLFHYFHLAYEDFFHRALRVPFQEFFSGPDAWAAPITHAEARFVAPLRHGDEIGVDAWIHRLRRGGWDWSFELRREDRLCAEGRVRHAFVDLENMERVHLPEAWKERVAPWVEEDEGPR